MKIDTNTLELAVEQIADYLDDERRDFSANPSDDHIFIAVETLRKWLEINKPGG